MTLLEGGLYSNYYLNFVQGENDNRLFSSSVQRRAAKNVQNRNKSENYKKNVYRVEYFDLEDEKINYNRSLNDFDLDDNHAGIDDLMIKKKPKLVQSEIAENLKKSKSGDGNKGNRVSSASLGMISENERKKINENTFMEKLLNLKKKDMDKNLNVTLADIKRKKEFLIEKYLEYQANNYNLIKRRKERERKALYDSSKDTFSSLSLKCVSQSPYKFTSSSAMNFNQRPSKKNIVKEDTDTDEELQTEKDENRSRFVKSAPAKCMPRKLLSSNTNLNSAKSYNKLPQPYDPLIDFHLDQMDLFDKFSTVYDVGYEKLPDRLKLKTPEKYNPFLESIKDKFVEQKLKYFPNYLKPKKSPNKISKTLEDFDKSLEHRLKLVDSKSYCSKTSQHRVKEFKAQEKRELLLNSAKSLVKTRNVKK